MQSRQLDDIDREILMILQKGLPLVSKPYEAIAGQIGGSVTESEVLGRIERMKQERVIRRISGFFESARLGYCSMLVAVKPKEGCFDKAACFINQYPGITHNYARSHEYSIWFTIIAINQPTLEMILDRIGECGYIDGMMRFSMAERYKINVTFDMKNGKGGGKHEPAGK